jgi:hypothetical protein
MFPTEENPSRTLKPDNPNRQSFRNLIVIPLIDIMKLSITSLLLSTAFTLMPSLMGVEATLVETCWDKAA